MKKWFAELLKWLLVIIMISAAFFFLCPKYVFVPVTIHKSVVMGSSERTIYICRCNKFTGRIEFIEP